jgi:hypothetical protein
VAGALLAGARAAARRARGIRVPRLRRSCRPCRARTEASRAHSVPERARAAAHRRGAEPTGPHRRFGARRAAIAVALWRAWRGADWITCAGWATLALLLGTAWLLPWYATWLTPLAALSPSRRLRAATLLFVAYVCATRIPFLLA